MATENVKRETIKRPVDEAACDYCECLLSVGDTAFIDLEHGTVYCSRACVEHDHFDRGYGPVCTGVSRW